MHGTQIPVALAYISGNALDYIIDYQRIYTDIKLFCIELFSYVSWRLTKSRIKTAQIRSSDKNLRVDNVKVVYQLFIRGLHACAGRNRM
jgi:hypothetical protein